MAGLIKQGAKGHVPRGRSHGQSNDRCAFASNISLARKTKQVSIDCSPQMARKLAGGTMPNYPAVDLSAKCAIVLATISESPLERFAGRSIERHEREPATSAV